MTLEDFWPLADNDHSEGCLFNEAETAAEAILLAVHQPMLLTKREENGAEQPVKEAQVLEALLAPHPSRTTIIPIIGDSGVGKSHLIRWLDSHLKLRGDAPSRYVVRIPKSASLPKVLELILEGLPQTDEYGRIRDQLQGAQMPTELDRTTELLKANLLLELQRKATNAAERIRGQEAAEHDHQDVRHCSGLQSMLGDPAILPHFINPDPLATGVLTRIADRFLHGAGGNDTGPPNQFNPDDLAFLQNVEIDKLSAPTRLYLPTLRHSDPPERANLIRIAIRCLNDVIDDAVGKLVAFAGTVSLIDVFLDIRRQLLKDERELVILVEDFAVLAGIQGPLLAAIIKEAVRNGRQELCHMRTAIAVTEGKLPESVKSRALNLLWSIKSEPFKDEDAAIAWYGNFVGGFLNAARHGQSVLKQKFNEASSEDQASGKWIPRQLKSEADEETQAILSAFGDSASGVPLFPFNHAIIEQFLRRQFGGLMAFKPRGFINGLLRDTLINHRGTWKQKQFPPQGYLGFATNKLALPAANFLREAIPKIEEWEHIFPLAFFWGGNPQNEQDVKQVPAGICRAFDRPQLGDEQPEPPESPEPPEISKISEISEISESVRDPWEEQWKQKLNDWRERGTLGQLDANSIRKMLTEAFKSQADPDSHLISNFEFLQTAVRLPWVTIGNANAFLVVFPEAEQTDQATADEFFGAIAAVTRYHTNFFWDYDGGEMDAVRYAAFIGKLVERWTPLLVAKARGEDLAQVVGLGTHLLINARILNLKGAASKTYSDNVAAILDPGSPHPPHPANTEDRWFKLQNAAFNARGELRTKLLERVGARQGGAATVHAIDPTRLLEGLQVMREDKWVPPQKAGGVEGLNDGTRNYLATVVGSELPRAVQARKERMGNLCNVITEHLGDDFDVEQIKIAFYDTVNASQKNGVFSAMGLDTESLKRRFSNLGPIKTQLGFAQNAVNDSNSVYGPILSKLAEVDSSVLERIVEALQAYDAFLTATSRAAEESLIDAAPQLDLVYPQLTTAMEKISASLNQLH
jgi:hypothetical protein